MFTELFSAIKDNFLEFFILIMGAGISLTGMIELIRSFVSIKKLKKHISNQNEVVVSTILSKTSDIIENTLNVVAVVEEIKIVLLNQKVLSVEQEAYINTVLTQDKELFQKYQKELANLIQRNNDQKGIEDNIQESDENIQEYKTQSKEQKEEDTVFSAVEDKKQTSVEEEIVEYV